MKNVNFALILIFAFAFNYSSLQAQWGGSTNTSNAIYRYGNVCIGGSSPEQLLTLSADDQPVLRFERTGGTNKWDFEIYATGGGQLRFRGGNNGTGSALQDHMIIKGNGKVTIGTGNTPSWYGAVDIDHFRLFVAGGILTEEVVVKTNWADYVFEKDYHLIPLREVESHIQQNGHLPNTPSAAEVENNGLHLGNITVNQQEKIEELFLHLIALEKRVVQLEKEKLALENQLNTEH